jgi:hypothetical protein
VAASAPDPSGLTAGGIEETAAVAAQHLDVGQEVVREPYGLGALEVGVAGCNRVDVLLRLAQQAEAELVDRVDDPPARRQRVEAQVGRDLVVAAARGVQLLARLTDLLGELDLEVHMDVLEGGVEIDRALAELLLDDLQGGDDLVGLLDRDDPLAREHAGVGDGPGDIVRQEAPVERGGRVEACRVGVEPGAETSTTHGGRHNTVGLWRVVSGQALRRRTLTAVVSSKNFKAVSMEVPTDSR